MIQYHKHLIECGRSFYETTLSLVHTLKPQRSQLEDNAARLQDPGYLVFVPSSMHGVSGAGHDRHRVLVPLHPPRPTVRCVPAGYQINSSFPQIPRAPIENNGKTTGVCDPGASTGDRVGGTPRCPHQENAAWATDKTFTMKCDFIR